jgi:hypothetical protein
VFVKVASVTKSVSGNVAAELGPLFILDVTGAGTGAITGINPEKAV